MKVDRGFAECTNAFDIIKNFQVIITVNMQVIYMNCIKFLHQLLQRLYFIGIYGGGYLQSRVQKDTKPRRRGEGSEPPTIHHLQLIYTLINTILWYIRYLYYSSLVK